MMRKQDLEEILRKKHAYSHELRIMVPALIELWHGEEARGKRILNQTVYDSKIVTSALANLSVGQEVTLDLFGGKTVFHVRREK